MYIHLLYRCGKNDKSIAFVLYEGEIKVVLDIIYYNSVTVFFRLFFKKNTVLWHKILSDLCCIILNSIDTHVYIYQPLHTGRMWHKVNFKVEFNMFEFRVFPLFDWLPNQSQRTQSALLSTHSWRENHWIHTFLKGISAIWNAINIIQDLNSCCHVHFLWQEPLHLYSCIVWCTHSAMVIIIDNGIGDLISNLGQGCLSLILC